MPAAPIKTLRDDFALTIFGTLLLTDALKTGGQGDLGQMTLQAYTCADAVLEVRAKLPEKLEVARIARPQ